MNYYNENGGIKMNLENIVPPLEDCKRIPEGAFKESAFVWVKTHTGKWVVGEAFLSCGIGSRRITALEHYPAPTLAEIRNELPDGTYVKKHGSSPVYEVFSLGHEVGYSDNTPATAALRLWERVKGGKNE